MTHTDSWCLWPAEFQVALWIQVRQSQNSGQIGLTCLLSPVEWPRPLELYPSRVRGGGGVGIGSSRSLCLGQTPVAGCLWLFAPTTHLSEPTAQRQRNPGAARSENLASSPPCSRGGTSCSAPGSDRGATPGAACHMLRVEPRSGEQPCPAGLLAPGAQEAGQRLSYPRWRKRREGPSHWDGACVGRQGLPAPLLAAGRSGEQVGGIKGGLAALRRSQDASQPGWACCEPQMAALGLCTLPGTELVRVRRWAVPALLPGSSPLLGEEVGVKGNPGAGAPADLPVFPAHP